MLLPIDRLVAALNRDYAKLLPQLPDNNTDGSSAQAIGHALQLLQARRRGPEWLAQVREDYTAMLEQVRAIAPTAGEMPELPDDIDAAWTALARAGEALMIALGRAPLSAADRARLCALATDWEEKAVSTQLDGGNVDEEADHRITAPRLESYLRDRFGDPSIAVDRFQPLPGGFGKETLIFAASGEALSGEFVIRRDPGESIILSNDCHSVTREYPVVRAARDRGFPAPDALWVETGHAAVPGGDFMVMRRSPGALGGNVFGARGTIGPGLAATLAGVAARLHTLPPLTELGTISSSIAPDMWQLSRGEATARYIRGWYDFWRSEAHAASPALAAIYGWLLDRVPDRPERASLLHGDIGFHNFLFDEGELTAVLDWEFAHVGDPAEELGYVKGTVGGALDWEAFMAAYVAAGGDPIDERTLHYFHVWGYARNASASNIMIERFANGTTGDLKITVLPHQHYVRFIRGAQALIAAAP